MSKKILLVEDDIALLSALTETLELSGYFCKGAQTGMEALQLLKDNTYHLVVSDINLGPGMNGIELATLAQKLPYHVPIIMMTAYASIENAVQAIKQGACDYLVKPFSPEKLLGLIARYANTREIAYNNPIAQDHQMKLTFAMAKKVAKTNATVLIDGESGTGKEVMAKFIHHHSKFSEGPFVAINCAAIPENMLEALLFGYEKGAFTGAIQSTAGKFEQAQQGTLFLDEIAEMPLSLQVKLLRVIQEKEVERLGSKKVIHLAIRIIAATNKNLIEQVEKRAFREDLFFRLNVVPIHLPSLNQRTLDVVPLSNAILKKFCKELERPEVTLSEQAQHYLVCKHWKGNIRELENVLHRALILYDDAVLQPKHLSHQEIESSVAVSADKETLGNVLLKNEFDVIKMALISHKGCRKQVAQELGISERTLRNKLAKMREKGIEVPDAKSISQERHNGEY